MQFTFIFSLIFAVIVAVFALLNPGTVTVNVLFTNFQTSQAVVILFSAFLGAILVYLLDLVKKIKSGFKNKELEKKLKGFVLEVEKSAEEVENFKSQNVDLMDENNQLKEKLEKLENVEKAENMENIAETELSKENKDEIPAKIDITK